MLKTYEEMRAVDVTPYCEDRDGYKYLNWARCIDLLHQHGAEKAYFEPIPNPQTGSSLYMTDREFANKSGVVNKCYETRIKVVVDDNEWVFQSPLLNGTNAVRDNSLDQLRVWTSMCRSFVKCIAIHTGLGFDLWLKEEEKVAQSVPIEEDSDPSVASIKVLKALCKEHKVNLDAWLKRQGRTEKTVTASEVATMLRAMKEKYEDD